MATSPARGGSSVSARSVSPSLNLAKLCELLAEALLSLRPTNEYVLPRLEQLALEQNAGHVRHVLRCRRARYW